MQKKASRSGRVTLLPVGWMMGPELLYKAYTALPRKFDPRSWMSPRAGHLHDERSPRARGTLTRADAGAGEPGEAPAVVAPDEEVWFDFIADTGDGSEAMYAVATAALSGFDCPAGLPDALAPGERVELTRRPAAGDVLAAGDLPRGQFLFVGGDTAYHVADEVTLRHRVEVPFHWAFEDLGLDGQTPETCLYGIPGNHDWYDDIEGFALLFQRPIEGDRTSIKLAGFRQVQASSYVALQLPFGWQLWGLDVFKRLDERQQRYFESLSPRSSAGIREPERLVVCTQAPPIKFGVVAPDEEHRDALARLLSARASDPAATPEDRRGPRWPDPDGPSRFRDLVPPPDRCRLDLSGDIHHYARYQREESPHYGCVVSGLGGAFHHPTFTRVEGEGIEREVALYPSEAESLQAITDGLLDHKSLIVGSWVRGVPFVFTLLLGLASTSSGGFGALCGRLLGPEAARGAGSPWLPLAQAGLLIGVLVGAALMLKQALWWFLRTAEAQAWDVTRKRGVLEFVLSYVTGSRPEERLSYRNQWPAALLTAAAVLAVAAFASSPLAPRARVAWLDVAAILLVVGGPLGGALAGYHLGAPRRMKLAGKVKLALAGLWLGTTLVTSCLLCARFAAAGLQGAPRDALVSGGLRLGLDVAIVLLTFAMLHRTRPLFSRGKGWALPVAGVWSAAWLAGMAGLACGPAAERLGGPPPLVAECAGYLVGAFMAAFLGPTYLAWYLAVAGLMNGHNNEVGGAARVARFRQIIRFHVTEGWLRGYVISVEERAEEKRSPVKQGGSLVFRLVDVFTITPPAGR